MTTINRLWESYTALENTATQSATVEMTRKGSTFAKKGRKKQQGTECTVEMQFTEEKLEKRKRHNSIAEEIQILMMSKL
jgi:glucan biosynthesis protein